MSDQDQDIYSAEGDDPAETEDSQLINALLEYGKSLDSDEEAEFRQRLKEDQAYFNAMGKALSEMAMLIAGAAVIEDDAEFVKTRRRILFESRTDSEELRDLRLYYLNNRHAVDMEPFLDGEESRARSENRLADFLNDYKQQHPQT